MPLPSRQLLALLAAGAFCANGLARAQSSPTLPVPTTPPTVAPGPFGPSDESLKQYAYPAWFRDAKLGIWAHWGPQSVPMDGDWYARNEYIQGSGQYEDHLQHYGHPTKTGWKDVIPLWRAEKWDPDRLMGLYKLAGARYFVSMACHHDNFDLWDSKYHRWNAVNMGPKRDVVGTWQAAAKRRGLRFGVSEHMGASFTWFQVARGADKTGPLAGVPYDGADPQYEDLYHWKAAPGDTGWYSNDPRWQREWYARVGDLVEHYKPDLLYTDGGIPFGNEVGRNMIANLYNISAAKNGGKADAIYTCKEGSNGRFVQDVERGVMPGIQPYPWQTDTSIGDWFYNRNWKYRGADWVVHTLVDVVSKNGNLLINVVQRPDGSLDPEAEQVLANMAAWIKVNGEAIYGSRPWLVYGEGRVKAVGGAFREDFAYTARDIRFTTKGNRTLYAAAMGWPDDRRIVIRSLGQFPGVTGKVRDVKLLGYKGKLTWTHTADGLTVDLPAEKPADYAVFLKISCDDVRRFKPELAIPAAEPIKADAGGVFRLSPDDAQMHGALKTESRGGRSNVGFWDAAGDYVSWDKVEVARAGTYEVSLEVAGPNVSEAVVEIGSQKLTVAVPATGSWDEFKTIPAGRVTIGQAGTVAVSVRPLGADTWRAINLAGVKLTPVQ